jgi:hypothetical protein
VSENSSLPLGSALPELAGLLLSTDSFEDLVQRVAELSVRTIGPATTCGITLAQDGRVITVSSADALASQLDEQQYEHHAGPCLEALKTGEVVESVDLAEEDRWGVYPSVAIGHGIRSVLSTPLIVNGDTVGVLNLYARDARVRRRGPPTRRAAGRASDDRGHRGAAALRRDHPFRALADRAVIAVGDRPGHRHPDGPTAVWP